MSVHGESILDYLEQSKGIILNEQQVAAVKQTKGHVLLLAVPGAGKTTVMCARIANLVYFQNIEPSRILSMTFSKAAAVDMEKRFQKLFGELGDVIPKFSTIHAFCYRVVRYYSSMRRTDMPRLIEATNQKPNKSSLLQEIYQNVNKEYLPEDTAEDLSNQISYIKNMMLTDAEVEDMATSCTNILKIYKNYESFKKENHLMDFDDMLSYTYTILNKFQSIKDALINVYDYICVDEAQDTSKLQHSIVRLLSENKSLFMVGDEDQSIYSFRGAYPKALLSFTNVYKDAIVLKMEQNFRSTKEIITASNRFIALNTDRYPKNMFTTREDGDKIAVRNLDNLAQQYSFIANELKQTPKDVTVGILYRNNHSCLPLLDVLEKEDLDFTIREHSSSFKNNLVVADILRFLLYSSNKGDYGLFSRIFYKCNSYLKRDTVRAMMLESTPCPDYMREVAFIADTNPDVKVSPGTIMRISDTIDRLKQKPPHEAIDMVVDDLGYLDYIRHVGNYSYVSVQLQKITVLKSIARSCNTIEELLERLDCYNEIIKRHSKSSSNVTLTTAHSSKGLEFDKVIIIDTVDGVFPSLGAIELSSQGEKSMLEEEARLFYVAVTRARDSLTVITSNHSDQESISPSRFIHRLMEEPKDKEKIAKTMLLAGQKIEHQLFGVGQIMSVDKERKVVVVFFRQNGTRTLTFDIFATNKVEFL